MKQKLYQYFLLTEKISPHIFFKPNVGLVKKKRKGYEGTAIDRFQLKIVTNFILYNAI